MGLSTDPITSVISERASPPQGNKTNIPPFMLKATIYNQILGTDMTKVKLPHTGWTYIVVVLDWHTK
jgi:hypothetical protein